MPSHNLPAPCDRAHVATASSVAARCAGAVRATTTKTFLTHYSLAKSHLQQRARRARRIDQLECGVLDLMMIGKLSGCASRMLLEAIAAIAIAILIYCPVSNLADAIGLVERLQTKSTSAISAVHLSNLIGHILELLRYTSRSPSCRIWRDIWTIERNRHVFSRTTVNAERSPNSNALSRDESQEIKAPRDASHKSTGANFSFISSIKRHAIT